MTRRSWMEGLGAVLHDLHHVPVPSDLLPPWLTRALRGGPWPAYHPPVVEAALRLVEAARRRPDADPDLLDAVAMHVRALLPLFAGDRLTLVHGDLHGSNVLVDGDRVTGIVDFAEAIAGAADAELDTILRWCARPGEFPPTPGRAGLDRRSLAAVPGWLRAADPELFDHAHLVDRLRGYDLAVELAILAHHPSAAVRATATARIGRLLVGHDRFDGLASR